MKLKLKAFTLVELIVTMILSAIVIAIGYTSYVNVQKRYLQYKKIREELNHAVMLIDDLDKKTIDSKLILKNENGIHFLNKDRIVEFKIFDSVVVRQENGKIDSFFVKCLNWQDGFLEESDTGKNHLIDKIEFDALLFNETIHFEFKKDYSSDNLIEFENSQNF